jgi:hypothetical protein
MKLVSRGCCKKRIINNLPMHHVCFHVCSRFLEKSCFYFLFNAHIIVSVLSCLIKIFTWDSLWMTHFISKTLISGINWSHNFWHMAYVMQLTKLTKVHNFKDFSNLDTFGNCWISLILRLINFIRWYIQ